MPSAYKETICLSKFRATHEQTDKRIVFSLGILDASDFSLGMDAGVNFHSRNTDSWLPIRTNFLIDGIQWFTELEPSPYLYAKIVENLIKCCTESTVLGIEIMVDESFMLVVCELW